MPIGNWIKRLATGLFVGILATVLLAVSVHILTIFLVPHFASAAGWSRLDKSVDRYRFVRIDEGDVTAASLQLKGLDPLFSHAVCLVSLEDGPVNFSFSAPGTFWSMSLYDRGGQILFSVNDRTAVAGDLDLLAVTGEQRASIREAAPQGLDETILVEAQRSDLLAMLHVFAPDERGRLRAAKAFERSVCETARLE